MKDSGVKWIGAIPNHWKTDRLKSILVERNESNNPVKTTEILSLTNTRGVIPYSEKGDHGNKAKENLEDYKLAYPNDIVLNSMNVIIGSVGLSKYFGCVSPVYYMLTARKKSATSIDYYNYVFQTKEFQQSLKGYGNGILEIRMRIPMEKLNTVMLPVPPLDEQLTIVSSIERQVLKIDNLIANQEAQIEKLKQYKASLISKVVTKGLNPNVPMKDSGVEWIGEIPENWEVNRFKFVATKLEKGSGISKEDIVVGGDMPCVRYGEIYTKYHTSFDKCFTRTNLALVPSPQYFSHGDLLFSGTGELVEEIGKSIVYLGNEQCLAGGDIIIARHKQNPAFMGYLMDSFYVQKQKSFGKSKLKVVHISATNIANIIWQSHLFRNKSKLQNISMKNVQRLTN